MHTPSPKYICPRCYASYDAETKYCGRCGADMTRASALEHAQRLPTRRSSGNLPAALAGTAEVAAIRDPAEVGVAAAVALDREAAPTAIAAGSDPGSSGGAIDVDDETDVDTRAASETAAKDAEPSWSGTHDRRVAASKSTWLGKLIDGRYRVIEVIGRGGMGVVYKVEHQRMGKIAAMKVLHTDLANEPEVLGRFRREAEAVSRLDHPNTVQVFDFGTADGAMYLIMEYVKGQDLGAVVRRDGPMPFARGAPLFAQICAALAEAHALGVVHRDLKPENILVTRTQSGRDFVKVLDFGLAKLGERGEPSEVTDRSAIVGTPYFMAPEQIRGEEVDARSDVYSLGALMYKVLTGEHAYQAKTAVGVLTKHLTSALEMPSTRAATLGVDIDADPLVWDRVDGLVARCMAKAPAHRFQSASELLEEIEHAWAECSGEGSPLQLAAIRPTARTATVKEPEKDRPAAPPRVADSVDYGIDSKVRLRRSDLDAYEQSLKRWSWARVAVVPLILLAIAGGAYWLLRRAERPLEHEREPNDAIADANPVAAGATFHGYAGKRISKAIADRDHVRLVRSGGGESRFVVSAHLTGLPNVDLELVLYDGTGAQIAVVDDAGVGEDEWLRPRAVSGTLHAAVGEAMHGERRLPVENVSDPYALTMTVEEDDPAVEVEPNDGDTDALPLAPGAAMMGWLERVEAVDCFRVAEAGRYRLTIEGADRLGVAWRVGDGLESTAREQEVDLAAGAIVRLRRTADGAATGAPGEQAAGQTRAAAGDYRLTLRR